MRNKILQKWRKNEIEIEYFKRQLSFQQKKNFMMIEEEEEKGNEIMNNDQNQQLKVDEKEEIDEKEDDEIYDEIRLQITSNLTMGDLECSATDVWIFDFIDFCDGRLVELVELIKCCFLKLWKIYDERTIMRELEVWRLTNHLFSLFHDIFNRFGKEDVV